MWSMSKLTDSERSAYRALLTKYGHKETDFDLREANLSWSADGTLEGFLWIVHVPTDRRVVYDLGRFRSSWLDAFEKTLQAPTFRVR
jgi:hypothetical protein